MSSATSTDLARAERAALPVVIGGGWLIILLAYRWSFTVSTFFLFAGWAALVITARLLWQSFWSLAVEVEPEADEALRVSTSLRGDLEREKKALLRSIKDVEFDRDMGKMSDAEAQPIIRVYRARAAEIIRTLDAGPVEDADASTKELIERELEARLGEPPAPIELPETRPPARAKAKKTKPKPAANAGVCTSCKTRNDPDATFCKKCGKRVQEAQA